MLSVSRYFSATTFQEKLKLLLKILTLQLRDWSITICFQNFKLLTLIYVKGEKTFPFLCFTYTSWTTPSLQALCSKPRYSLSAISFWTCRWLNKQLFCLSPRQHNYVIACLKVNPPVGCEPKSTIFTTNIQTFDFLSWSLCLSNWRNLSNTLPMSLDGVSWQLTGE